jgi:hypothetical protein
MAAFPTLPTLGTGIWAGFVPESGKIPAQIPGWQDSRPDGGGRG